MASKNTLILNAERLPSPLRRGDGGEVTLELNNPAVSGDLGQCHLVKG